MSRGFVLLSSVVLALGTACTSASTDGLDTLDGGARDASDGKCRSDSDCRVGHEHCYAVGEQRCGGTDGGHECTTDWDCTASRAHPICVEDSCGAKLCAAKCTSDADCRSSFPVCDKASGRCGPEPCTSTSCPENFTCDGARGCVRMECTTDAQCHGTCVNRACYADIGYCDRLPD